MPSELEDLSQPLWSILVGLNAPYPTGVDIVARIGHRMRRSPIQQSPGFADIFTSVEIADYWVWIRLTVGHGNHDGNLIPRMSGNWSLTSGVRRRLNFLCDLGLRALLHR